MSVRLFSRRTVPKRVFELVKGQFVEHCKGWVSHRWAVQGKESALQRATHIIIATTPGVKLRTGKSATKILGFALLDSRKATIYIDVVCSSKRKGRAIIQRAESFGKSLQKSRVDLSALPHVVGYYKKLGYVEKTNACSVRSKITRKGSAVNGYRMTKCIEFSKPIRKPRKK